MTDENDTAAEESHSQTPDTQASLGPHVRPQSPQFVGSVLVSAHAVPQSVRPPGQVHSPPAHSRPAAQASLHAPQWSVLVSVSTQLDPHWVSEPHPVEQLASRQTSPESHAAPHSPQWIGSDAMSTQPPPHDVSGGEQSHCPPEHPDPLGHALSHAPQWLALESRSTHLPPHSLVGAGQAH
jgi:hypothetical protein